MRAEQSGADSITLHLREDRRHMQDADIYALRGLLQTSMNLECAVTDEMIDIACKSSRKTYAWCQSDAKSAPRKVGWMLCLILTRYKRLAEKLAAAGCSRFTFYWSRYTQIDASKKTGAPVMELHTGTIR